MEHVDMLMGVILPYANFFIFLALAIYFFRKPAIGAAAKRREDYAKLLAEATRARDEATAKLQQLTQRLSKIDHEIADIMTMARQAAEGEAAKIVSDAERLATHLEEEARRIAAAEVDKARGELRHEIVKAVREGVTKKIQTDVKPDAHLSLVRKQIGAMQTIKAEG